MNNYYGVSHCCYIIIDSTIAIMISGNVPVSMKFLKIIDRALTTDLIA